MDPILSKFNQDCLTAHNTLRSVHDCTPLSLDPALIQSAQAYANELAKRNTLAHSGGGGNYGENLAYSFNSAPDFEYTGKAVTLQWYKEIEKVDFAASPLNFSGAGHFTQVVWKSSKQCGFGRAKSASGAFFVVGQYTPAGNMMGQFEQNVPAPVMKFDLNAFENDK